MVHGDRFVCENVVFTAVQFYFDGVFVNGRLESQARQGEIEWTSLSDKLRICKFLILTRLIYK